MSTGIDEDEHLFFRTVNLTVNRIGNRNANKFSVLFTSHRVVCKKWRQLLFYPSTIPRFFSIFCANLGNDCVYVISTALIRCLDVGEPKLLTHQI